MFSKVQLVVLALALVAISTARAYLASPFTRVRAAPNKALGVSIKVGINEEEPIENTLKRFKRLVNQSGHLMELRFREQWETSADKKKRKSQRAKLLDRMEKTNDRNERRAEMGTEYI